MGEWFVSAIAGVKLNLQSWAANHAVLEDPSAAQLYLHALNSVDLAITDLAAVVSAVQTIWKEEARGVNSPQNRPSQAQAGPELAQSSLPGCHSMSRSGGSEDSSGGMGGTL
jgi:hypothetical protein